MKTYFDSVCGYFTVPEQEHLKLVQWQEDEWVLGRRLALALMGGYGIVSDGNWHLNVLQDPA